VQPNDEQIAGILLVSARARLGLSQTAFASLVGVAQSTLSAYESGRRQPTLPTLLRLLRQAGFALRTDLVVAAPPSSWVDLLDDDERAWLQARGVPLPSAPRADDQGNSRPR
jgi:transcriptional regulator with XRE-family HTH domain